MNLIVFIIKYNINSSIHYRVSLKMMSLEGCIVVQEYDFIRIDLSLPCCEKSMEAQSTGTVSILTIRYY